MGRYRLTPRARRDLDEIYEYGFTTFGEYQADAYHSGLERMFGLLADFPRMAPKVEGFNPLTRRFRFQSHFIYYREQPSFVSVLAIVHHARDWRRKPF
jgi:toxin ParE1/3/4